MGLCNGRVSVRLSVCLSRRPIAAAAWAGLLLSALQAVLAVDRYLLQAGARAQQQIYKSLFIEKSLFCFFLSHFVVK